MSSIFDVEEDMWNVPITPYLLVEVFKLRPLPEDKTYVHMIGFRTPNTHYFGVEPVRVFRFCGRWFIEMQYPYTRNRVSINEKLGYPKQINTMRDVINEFEKIYDALETETKVKIDKKLQV
jgi:hypothetical protein